MESGLKFKLTSEQHVFIIFMHGMLSHLQTCVAPSRVDIGFLCGKLQFNFMFGPLIAVNMLIQDMECLLNHQRYRISHIEVINTCNIRLNASNIRLF